MKPVFRLLLFAFVTASCNKKDSTVTPALPERYKDEIFTNVTIVNNIKYGQALRYTGSGIEDLYLDLYQPEGDVSTSRPLVIGVHGGAFITGDKQAANWPEVCKAFAKRGYVAASINYRLGRGAGEEYEPAWRAQQDLRAAIRYARANAAVIKINPAKIYIMGSSAGGATCLITAYMDAGEAPSSINQTLWGNIEGNSGSPGYSSAVSGVVSMWGGVSDTLGITGPIPVGLLHSLYDPTAPYQSSYDPVRNVTTYGSYSINQRAKNTGIVTDLKTYYYNGHDDGLYPPYLDSTIKFSANFLYPFAK
jgi:para-nitrobenzyl esterase